MTIAMILGRSTGGIGWHVADLSALLTDLGEEVIVLTDDLTQERFQYPRVRLGWPSMRRPLRSLRQARAWRRTLREAEIVHAHGFQAGIVAAALLGGHSRGRLVVSLHNTLPDGGATARLGRRAARWMARSSALMTGASADLVALADDLGAQTTALAPVPSPRVGTLLATDRDAWRSAHRGAWLAEHGIDGRRPLILTISRIAPQKRLHDLLTATAHGPAGADWVVIGDGDRALRDELQARIVDEHLPVRLLGAIEDPSPWLLAADAFALTSTWEARALVVQEAMAAGTPVVATRTGGLPDLLDGVGTLVQVGATAAIGRAVTVALDEPKQAVRTREARARAATWPSPQDTARMWRGWYADLRP